MCMICDGATPDEVLFHHHGMIERYGWAGVSVGDDPHWQVGWVYTIGLTARGQPELVIMGIPPDRCAPIVEALARRVLEGEVLIPGDAVEWTFYGVPVLVELVSVHPDHLDDGLVRCAADYYRAIGWPPGCVDAIQLLVPSWVGWCEEHAVEPPRLNDAEAWAHP